MSRRAQGWVRRRGRKLGFVWVEGGHAIIYSCYISPRSTFGEYEAFLEELGGSLMAWSDRKLVVLAGDFNAKAKEWGSVFPDAKGDALREMTGKGGLLLANNAAEHTHRRTGRVSFLDLTWFSEGTAGRVEEWRVLDAETMSNHRYLAFEIRTGATPQEVRVVGRNAWTWNPRKLDLGTAKSYIQEGIRRGTLAETPDQLVNLLQGACVVAARGSPPGRLPTRKSKYWWTAETAEKRRTCVRLHRICNRRRQSAEDYLVPGPAALPAPSLLLLLPPPQRETNPRPGHR